jgi:AAA domain
MTDSRNDNFQLPGAAIATDPDFPWRTRYHSFKEVNEAPDPTFVIENFLQEDVVTALAAPVSQRKSIMALNVAHACCTGEPLFDHFKVIRKPAHVIYLCPEMGLLALAKRIRLIGLMPFVEKTFFLRSMNSEGFLLLSELIEKEVSNAVLIIDTAARFIQGNENSSEYMKVFSEECFGVMRLKPAAMLVLYHSGKETKLSSELSLENAMRGSGELGAAVSTCWATRLQDPSPDKAWDTPSYITNVKQRDFESKAFEATSGPDYRMHIVGVPGEATLSRVSRTAANKDGKDATAVAFMLEHPGLSERETVLGLGQIGIKRGKTWVNNKRFEQLQANNPQLIGNNRKALDGSVGLGKAPKRGKKAG